MAASAPALADLLQRADLWRGGQLAGAAVPVVTSGFAALDAVLPGGGWPCGELTELLCREHGIGELSLLQPTLSTLDHEAGWIAVVAPPWQAHAPAWQAAGVPLERLLMVDATAADAAWACEHLLASGALAALLAWLPDCDTRGLRRLQLAAHGRRSLAFVFRPHAAAGTASPAPLRLRLDAGVQALAVELIKRRGPPLAQPLQLQVRRPLPWSRLQTAPAGSPPAVPAPRSPSAASRIRPLVLP